MSTARFEKYVLVAQKFGARTVLFQEAAAKLLEISATQLECFQLIRHVGPLTAVDLSRETGLTQASISTIVEKLVDKGFVCREQDSKDRRKWILKAEPDASLSVDSIYANHVVRTTRLLKGYSSAEFDAALGFMEKLGEELKITAIEMNQRDIAKTR